MIPAAPKAPYQITYSYSSSGNNDDNFTDAIDSPPQSTLTVNQAMPVFSNLTLSQAITYGTPYDISVGSHLCPRRRVPAQRGDIVTITISTAHQDVTIGANGTFSTTTFPTDMIPRGADGCPTRSRTATTATATQFRRPATTIQHDANGEPGQRHHYGDALHRDLRRQPPHRHGHGHRRER